jgi:hypothetical protein
MRLVLNRADVAVGLRRPEVEGALGVSVDFELPSVQDVPIAVNRGTPLALSSPTIEFSRAVRNMSNSLLGRTAVSTPVHAEPEEAEPTRRPLVSTVRTLATGWLPRSDKRAADAAKEPA